MRDESLSDSEEDILVYAEFEENLNIDKYRTVHVLGMNGKTPIVQMDDTCFTGQYENPLGTYMFFEEDPSPQCSDPLFDKLQDKNLKYLFKTRKFLKMEHAYVSPKENKEQTVKSELDENDDDVEMVNFKSLPEALEKFRYELMDTAAPESSLNSGNANIGTDEDKQQST